MKFHDDNLKVDEQCSDTDSLNIDVTYYDEGLDCENETSILIVKNDIKEMAKKLGMTPDDFR